MTDQGLHAYAGSDSETETATNEPLRGKTCVVTGASRGIGSEIAREFGRAGAAVVVNYRSSAEEADRVAERIDEAESSGSARALRADVADFEAVTTMVDRVHDALGRVDVLVNNAGITIDTPIREMTPADWNRVIDVNLGGAFNCTRALYDDVREADEGRVINVSSVVGRRGNYGQANYAASKAGLFGFTRSLALELAPTGSTANCVAPGFTKTEMVDAVRDDIQDRIRERIPLGRFATVEEIACTVRFLATDEASYLTGEVLNVNGGMYG